MPEPPAEPGERVRAQCGAPGPPPLTLLSSEHMESTVELSMHHARVRRHYGHVNETEAELASSTESLASAQEQLAIARIRLSEVRSELDALSVKSIIRPRRGITRADERELGHEFAHVIESVASALTQEQDAHVTARASLASSEQAAAGMVAGGLDEGGGLPPAVEVKWFPPRTEQTVVILGRFGKGDDEEEEQHAVTASFRLHEVYTFFDLKNDMCRFLGLSRKRAEAMELWNPHTGMEWREAATVLVEMRKPEHDGFRDGRVHLRDAPIFHVHAVEDAFDNKAEAELQVEMFARAQAARRRAETLRSIALERKASRHARSLIVRGAVHCSFTLLFGLMLYRNPTYNRGYYTQLGVRQALNQPFSELNLLYQDLTCAQRKQIRTDETYAEMIRDYAPSAVKNRLENAINARISGEGVGADDTLRAPTPTTEVRLPQIRNRDQVAAWLKGPLIDILAPRCAYNFAEFDESTSNTSGSVRTVNTMMIPLRLQQTRYLTQPDCVYGGRDDRVLWSYPGYNESGHAANAHMYPVCGTENKRTTSAYGPRTKAFTYSPKAPTKHDYTYCGAKDYLTSGTKCYGSDGYILDLWSARDYRPEIDKLISGGWIDEMTESVAVHLQLANMQTGCMVFVVVLFEFMSGGRVHTNVEYGVKCERPGAPQFTGDHKDFANTQLMNFHYREPIEILVYGFMVLYMLRIAGVQAKILRRGLATGSLQKLLTYPYMVDTLLGIALLTSLAFELVQVLWINGMFTYLWQARRDALIAVDEAEFDKIADLWNYMTTPAFAEMLGGGEVGELQSMRAREELKNAIYLGQTYAHLRPNPRSGLVLTIPAGLASRS